MPSRLLTYSTFLFTAALTAGCGGTAAEAPAPIDNSNPVAAATAIDVRRVDYAGLLEFIASHRGHPIVLDVWSTSCDPCIRELPNLARLQADYADRDVVCATLNIDYTGAEDTTPEDAKDDVLSILTTLGVNVHNFYSTVPDRELFRNELFKENRVYAVPVIFLFNESGEAVGTFRESSEDTSPYSELQKQLDLVLAPQ